MTADPATLTRTDRRRLELRLAELRGLDELMRQPGGLAEAPEPVPLHRSRTKAKFSTITKVKFSTAERTTS